MRWQLALLTALAAASSALGHFVFVVPAESQREVQVVFSDTLEPDENVPIDKIAATELFVIDAAGKQTSLKWQKGDHALRAVLPVPRPVLIGGVTNYGVAQSKHTGNIPVLLKYYPKAVIGDLAAAADLRLGKSVPVEIIPQIREGTLQFKAVRFGKPAPGADCVVQIAGGKKGERLKTDADGQVPRRFDKSGRYGVWVKVVEATPGELKGKKYDQVNSYATLVVDFGPTGR